MVTDSPQPAPTAGTTTPLTRDRVRWAILAPGTIAAKFAQAITSLPDEAELVAVGSRSQQRADDFAATWQIRQSYGSYQELVANPDIDAIYIASPHNLHREQAELAMRAGKHVLIEKPMTVSQADALAVLQVAEQTNRFCMEAMWTRCHPLVLQAAEFIRSGRLGDPRFLWCTFAFVFDGDDDHRLLNPDLAGGALWDLGVYPAHAAHVLLGRPTSISTVGNRHPRTGVDITAMSQVSWGEPNERIFGTLVCSLQARGDQRLSVFGSAGQLTLDNFLAPQSMTFTPEGGEPQHFVTQDAGLIWQAQEVHRCLRAGVCESAAVPWQSTIDVSWMLDQMRGDIMAQP